MPLSEEKTVDVLIELYNEQCEHGRHIEKQRQEVTNLLLTLSGALIALMGILKLTKYCFPLAGFLILIGVLGWLFMRAFERKWDESGERRNFYRRQIEQLTQIETPPPPQNRKTLRKLWEGISILVIVIGVAFVMVIALLLPLHQNPF
jgi:hypothetical protein